MVGDKIAISTKDPALKERLFRLLKLDLQKAVDISRSSELAHKELRKTQYHACAKRVPRSIKSDFL